MKRSHFLTWMESHMAWLNCISLSLALLLYFIGPILNLGYYGGLSLFNLSFGENMQDMLYGNSWIGMAILAALGCALISYLIRQYLISALCNLIPVALFGLLYFTLLFSETGNEIGLLGWGFWMLAILFVAAALASLFRFFTETEMPSHRKIKDQIRFHTGGIQIPELAARPVYNSYESNQSCEDLEEKPVCGHCLKENESSALYCIVCGTPLTVNKQA